MLFDHISDRPKKAKGKLDQRPEHAALLSGRACELNIMKTRLYNFDPLKPYLYIVKLGFNGVYIIFLISALKT